MLRVRATRGWDYRCFTDRFTDKAFFVRFRRVFVRRMTDDRKSGLARIAGSVGMIVTMAVHPRGMVSAAQVESMARNLTAVHSLARVAARRQDARATAS